MGPMDRVNYLRAPLGNAGPGVAYGNTTAPGSSMVSANASVGGQLGVRATGFLVLALLALIVVTELNHR